MNNKETFDTSDDGKTFLGHPQGLMTLFFSEMWERFCYYGMRVLLTLYLVKSLMKGDAEASIIYGSYTALVYAAPVLGGRLADRYLGYRYAILLGAVLMAIGEFMILGGGESFLLVGMGAIIVGNGYFKANISTIVGKLYKDGDPRRDSGFTIFYIGINIGALLATTVVAIVGETYGFDKGFALAGFGMLMGMLIFWFGRNNYSRAEGLEVTPAGKKTVFGPINMVHLITVGSLFLIPLCYFLISKNEILEYLLYALFLYVAYSLISAGAKEGKIWKDRMIALVIMMVLNVVFWACFEQAGTSLTLFADRNVNREIFGWLMPATMTQFFNPAFIIIFGSIFSVMWVKLSKIGKNPSIPMKFALGIFQLGLGFLVALVGLSMESDFKVPLLILVFLYLLHTTGELFISPIGLSMVSKLSPRSIAGTAMGGWFLSFAIANYLGGQIAALTSEKGSSKDSNKIEEVLSEKTTLKSAIEKSSKTINFEDWPKLHKDLPPNISLQEYVNVKDWVEFRNDFSSNVTFGEWLSKRSLNDTIKTADQWLDESEWKELSTTYTAIIVSDSIAEANNQEAGIDYKSWLYFRDGIEKLEEEAIPLQEAYSKHSKVKLEKGLNKYVSVFSTIGYILIIISLLIALLSRPLNRLMHGID